MYFRTARAAMVALTAIGMIFTTAAHAAPVDGPATSVYGNTGPINSVTTSVHSPAGVNLQISSDVKVTYFSKVIRNGSIEWTYKVENIGAGVAPEVGLQMMVRRNNGVVLGKEAAWRALGDLAPGVARYATITCKAEVALPACSSSVATAFLKHEPNAYPYANDVNPYNNTAESN
jgi:hypothetical protein